MANTVYSETFNMATGMKTVRNYHEFDPEVDGPNLAKAMLDAYGTREACKEEMLYMTMVAVAKDDLTTINGMACIRAYWRLIDSIKI